MCLEPSLHIFLYEPYMYPSSHYKKTSGTGAIMRTNMLGYMFYLDRCGVSRSKYWQLQCIGAMMSAGMLGCTFPLDRYDISRVMTRYNPETLLDPSLHHRNKIITHSRVSQWSSLRCDRTTHRGSLLLAWYNSIPAWISDYIHLHPLKYEIKLLVHSLTSTVQSLTFRNG